MAVKPSLRKEDWKGRQKVGCGYPPSIARSQKVRGGILGITIQKREQSFGAALLNNEEEVSEPHISGFKENIEKFKEKQPS